MKMKASFQPLTGVVRVHPFDGHWRNFSNYSWACTVQIVDECAYFHGVDRVPTAVEWHAIGVEMARRNFLEIHFDRITNGRKRHGVVDLKRFR